MTKYIYVRVEYKELDEFAPPGFNTSADYLTYNGYTLHYLSSNGSLSQPATRHIEVAGEVFPDYDYPEFQVLYAQANRPADFNLIFTQAYNYAAWLVAAVPDSYVIPGGSGGGGGGGGGLGGGGIPISAGPIVPPDIQQFGSKKKDFFQGTADSEFYDGKKKADTIALGDGDDEGHGGKGSDYLYGEGGNDKLFGEKNNDNIDGGEGSDYISGGKGRDTLTGGGGADAFYFNEKLKSKNVDVITDFTPGEDQIWLDSGRFISDVGLVRFDSDTGEVFYDKDGWDGGKDAKKICIITAGIFLTVDDIVFV